MVNNPLNRWSDFPSGGSRSVGGTLRPQAKYWYGLEFGTFPTLQSSHHSGSWVGWAPFISGTVGCDLLPVPSEKIVPRIVSRLLTCQIEVDYLPDNEDFTSLWCWISSMVGKCQSIFLVADGQFDTLPQKTVSPAKNSSSSSQEMWFQFRVPGFFSWASKVKPLMNFLVKRIPINVPRDAGLEIGLKKVLE